MASFWKLGGGIQAQAGKPFYHQDGGYIKVGQTEQEALASQQVITNHCLCKYPFQVYYQILAKVPFQSYLDIPFYDKDSSNSCYPFKAGQGYQWGTGIYKKIGCKPAGSGTNGKWETFSLPYKQISNTTSPAFGYMGQTDTGPYSCKRMIVSSYRCCNGVKGCGVAVDQFGNEVVSDSQADQKTYICKGKYKVVFDEAGKGTVSTLAADCRNYKALQAGNATDVQHKQSWINCNQVHVSTYKFHHVTSVSPYDCADCMASLNDWIEQTYAKKPEVTCKKFHLLTFTSKDCRNWSYSGMHNFNTGGFNTLPGQLFNKMRPDIVSDYGICIVQNTNRVLPTDFVADCKNNIGYMWYQVGQCSDSDQTITEYDEYYFDCTGAQCDSVSDSISDDSGSQDSSSSSLSGAGFPCNVPFPPYQKYRTFTHDTFNVWKAAVEPSISSDSYQTAPCTNTYKIKQPIDPTIESPWEKVNTEPLFDFEVIQEGWYQKQGMNQLQDGSYQYILILNAQDGTPDPITLPQSAPQLINPDGGKYFNCSTFFAVYWNVQDCGKTYQPHSTSCKLWEFLGAFKPQDLEADNIPGVFWPTATGWKYVAEAEDGALQYCETKPSSIPEPVMLGLKWGGYKLCCKTQSDSCSKCDVDGPFKSDSIASMDDTLIFKKAQYLQQQLFYVPSDQQSLSQFFVTGLCQEQGGLDYCVEEGPALVSRIPARGGWWQDSGQSNSFCLYTQYAGCTSNYFVILGKHWPIGKNLITDRNTIYYDSIQKANGDKVVNIGEYSIQVPVISSKFTYPSKNLLKCPTPGQNGLNLMDCCSDSSSSSCLYYYQIQITPNVSAQNCSGSQCYGSWPSSANGGSAAKICSQIYGISIFQCVLVDGQYRKYNEDGSSAVVHLGGFYRGQNGQISMSDLDITSDTAKGYCSYVQRQLLPSYVCSVYNGDRQDENFRKAWLKFVFGIDSIDCQDNQNGVQGLTPKFSVKFHKDCCKCKPDDCDLAIEIIRNRKQPVDITKPEISNVVYTYSTSSCDELSWIKNVKMTNINLQSYPSVDQASGNVSINYYIQPICQCQKGQPTMQGYCIQNDTLVGTAICSYPNVSYVDCDGGSESGSSFDLFTMAYPGYPTKFSIRFNGIKKEGNRCILDAAADWDFTDFVFFGLNCTNYTPSQQGTKTTASYKISSDSDYYYLEVTIKPSMTSECRDGSQYVQYTGKCDGSAIIKYRALKEKVDQALKQST